MSKIPKLSKCAGSSGVLAHVLVSGPNATATEGRLMVTVPHGMESDPVAPTLVPAEVWAMMEKAKRPPTLEADSVLLDSGVCVPLGECPEASCYPDRAKFEPTDAPIAVIHLDARLLLLIAQALHPQAGAKSPLVVTLEISSNKYQPIRISAPESEGSALLMPCTRTKNPITRAGAAPPAIETP